MDGFTVDSQPLADFLQRCYFLLRDCAVRLGADVEKQAGAGLPENLASVVELAALEVQNSDLFKRGQLLSNGSAAIPPVNTGATGSGTG